MNRFLEWLQYHRLRTLLGRCKRPWDRLWMQIARRMPAWIKPNHLTIARFPLCGLVGFCLFGGQKFLAILLFAVALLTDVLDGKVAVLRREMTELGAWLDPTADKFAILSFLWPLGWNQLPFFLLVAITAVEITLVLGRLFKPNLGRNPSVKSTIFGKFKMAFQSAGVMGLIVGSSWSLRAANILLWIALPLGLLSVLSHSVPLVRAAKGKRRARRRSRSRF